MEPTAESMHEIATACATECIRQQVGVESLADLIQAYGASMLMSVRPTPTEADVHRLAGIVNGFTPLLRYRLAPATFASSRAGLGAEEIPDAMSRLFAYLDEDTDPAEFVRAFLSIHPFSDGNGRTAFILYNWLSNTLDHPQALPDFNWDD